MDPITIIAGAAGAAIAWYLSRRRVQMQSGQKLADLRIVEPRKRAAAAAAGAILGRQTQQVDDNSDPLNPIAAPRGAHLAGYLDLSNRIPARYRREIWYQLGPENPTPDPAYTDTLEPAAPRRGIY